MGGIEPPPIQLEGPSESLGVNGTLCGGGGGGASAPDDCEARLSFDSSLLFFKASNKSTRSLHCSSNCRNDSKRAFSVEDVGR